MSRLSAALLRAVSTRREVAIADCVHYCGFRYGRDELNPYEQVQKGLVAGLSRGQVRATFVDFLRHYRPRSLGEALGQPLSRELPLWHLPWRSSLRTRSPAWVDTPAQVVDVMTHFSELGIPEALVQQEHDWHELAFARMSREGYRPTALQYARVIALQSSVRTAYLVTDGNHRISALSALGIKQLVVTCVLGSTVRRDDAASWPRVRRGEISLADALAVFDVYHHGNLAPRRAKRPAELVST